MAVRALRVVKISALALPLVAAAMSTAMAAGPDRPDGPPGRYTMHPADGGFLRLDTQTGQMSMCQRSAGSAGGAWNCSMLPDERVALERENQDLKTAVKRLEDLAGVAGPREADDKGPMARLPTEDDVDKAMSYVQRMLKKFREKVRELEDQDKKGTNL